MIPKSSSSEAGLYRATRSITMHWPQSENSRMLQMNTMGRLKQ